MNDNIFLMRNQAGVKKKVLRNGNVIIPKEMRDQYGLKPGTLIEIIPLREGFYIRRVTAAKEG